METHKCVLCGKVFEGYGNNPEPLARESKDARACDECNFGKVVPARMKEVQKPTPVPEITSIRLSVGAKAWVDKNNISLSKLVRKALIEAGYKGD